MKVFAIDAAERLVVADGRQHRVFVAATANGTRWAFCDGTTWRIQDARPTRVRARGPVHDRVSAPMPATVVRIAVEPGASVSHGDTVVIVEAMKMELPLRAPRAGTVVAVNCQPGELVQPDTTLVEIE